MFYSLSEVEVFSEKSAECNMQTGLSKCFKNFVIYEQLCMRNNRPLRPLQQLLEKGITAFSSDEVAKLIREAFLRKNFKKWLDAFKVNKQLWQLPIRWLFYPGPTNFLRLSSLRTERYPWINADEVCIKNITLSYYSYSQ